MNKGSILSRLNGPGYSNLTEVGPDVVRVERHHDGHHIGVVYFDFSEDVARPEFNIQAYVQQRIASDFYKHEGSLQWNYYVNFVLERAIFERFHGTSKATAIESDQTIARKRICELEALSAELGKPFASALLNLTLG